MTSHGFGLMALGEPAFGSATPSGIMRLLAHYKIDVSGKRAVVVGRSRHSWKADGADVIECERDGHAMPFEDSQILKRKFDVPKSSSAQ